MAFGAREFVLRIVADVKDAQDGFKKVETSSATMKDKVVGFGKGIGSTLAIGAVVAFGGAVVNTASEAEQSLGAMHSVFGSFASDMDAFGKTTAENLGISRQEFNQLSAVTGSLLKNAGLPMQEVTKSTQELTLRAADLASMYGTDVPTAVEAMGSAFKGEFDPLEKFGVSLKASDVTARAMAEGYVDASGEVTDAGKAIAAQEMIMEQSASAAGNFAKESDTLAGKTQIMKARFADTQAELGQKLLPIVVKVMEAMSPLVDLFMKYSGVLIPLAAIIGGIALATKAYALAEAAASTAKQIATGVQWAFNAAMMANPIVLIVAAIAAVIAAVVLLYMKVDWFRAAVDAAIGAIVSAFQWLWDIIVGVFNWVKDNWPLLLAILTGPFGLAVKVIIDHWDTIKEAVLKVFNWIKDNWPLLLAILTGPFGLAVLAIVRNWDTIKDFFYRLPGMIQGWLSGLWDILTYPFRTAADAVKNAFEPVKDFFYRLPGQINGWLSNVGNIIKYPFEQAFNGIKWLWNNTVGRISFTVPDWVPGIGGKGWSAPKLAKGGIVTRPTLALIGEAGPEAVVPLSRGGFGGATINVYALSATAEVGRKVFEALREYERTSGKSIA